MSPLDASGAYQCAHCRKIFWSREQLGGHVHAQHPEHRRKLSTTGYSERPRRRAVSLKRATDTWPARP